MLNIAGITGFDRLAVKVGDGSVRVYLTAELFCQKCKLHSHVEACTMWYQPQDGRG
jgi:hypothetical protein